MTRQIDHNLTVRLPQRQKYIAVTELLQHAIRNAAPRWSPHFNSAFVNSAKVTTDGLSHLVLGDPRANRLKEEPNPPVSHLSRYLPGAFQQRSKRIRSRQP